MRTTITTRPVRADRGILSLPSFEGGLRIMLILNLFDALATIGWIEAGLATEANPVMAGALEGGPAAFILSKVALVTLAAGLLWRFRKETFARLALIPVGMLYAGVAGTHVGFALYRGLVALVPSIGL